MPSATSAAGTHPIAEATAEVLFDEAPSLELAFDGEVILWRGPSPFHFVAIPEGECREIADVSSLATYGWGVIPVTAHLGETRWTTSLFPRQGSYLLPLKDVVRKAERIEVGETVSVRLEIVLGRQQESEA